jgi:DNA topoisomerase IB
LVAIGPASTETKRNIAQAVKETAKHLGNRPAACWKYYIQPAVFASYYEQTIFSVLKNVPEDTVVPADKLSTVSRQHGSENRVGIAPSETF